MRMGHVDRGEFRRTDSLSLMWPCSARSGVVLLKKGGSTIQNLQFGVITLDQMREKVLAKWQDIEATAGRNQARAWLDVSITYHFMKGSGWT